MNDFVKETYAKIADKYTDQYFDDLSDTPYIDQFLKLLPVGAKTLEVGCGPGQFLRYVKDKGFAIEGIDLSPEMVAIAHRRVPDISVQEMNMKYLSYADSSFDGLIALYSLIHIKNEEIGDVLKEFKRVLRPEGLVEIIVQVGEVDHLKDDPLMPTEKIFVNFFTKKRLLSHTEAYFETIIVEEIASSDPVSMSKGFIHYIGKVN